MGTMGGRSERGGDGKPRKLGRGLSALLGVGEAVRVEVPSGGETAGGSAGVAAVGAARAAGAAGGAGGGGGAAGHKIEHKDGSKFEEGLVQIDIERIERSPFQPRSAFGEEGLDALADSIAQQGVMQPIVVRPSLRGGAGRYELVAGERRWRAAGLAGLKRVPAIVRALSDRESAEWALVENVQREDLNPMEKAAALGALCERFGLSHAEVADRVGVDRTSVTNLIRLLELEAPVRQMIADGRLNAGHGKVLLGMAGSTDRVRLAERAAGESWSVRRLEREARRAMQGIERGGAGTRGRSPDLDALEQQLGEHLGTRVTIRTDGKGTKGRIIAEFFDLDHFDALTARMGFRVR